MQVFMLSADAVVDEAVLLAILESGHSRVPVHKPGSRCAMPNCCRAATCSLWPQTYLSTLAGLTWSLTALLAVSLQPEMCFPEAQQPQYKNSDMQWLRCPVIGYQCLKDDLSCLCHSTLASARLRPLRNTFSVLRGV